MYDGPTVFTPRIDDTAEPAPVQFEKHGPSRSIRKYTGFPEHLPLGGDHVHGDESDFMGESLAAKYSYRIGDGARSPCMVPGTMKLGLKLDIRHIPYVNPSSLAFGISSTVPPTYARGIGLKLGCKAYKVNPPYPGKLGLGLGITSNLIRETIPKKIGLNLGIAHEMILPSATKQKVGLDLAVGHTMVAPGSPKEKVGLDLAVGHTMVAPGSPKEKVGLDLAVGHEMIAPAITTQEIGLHLAVGHTMFSPAITKQKVGLYLGLKNTGLTLEEHHDDTTIAPGSACGSAGVITPGFHQTQDITGMMTEQWWTWTETASTTYYVKVTINTGSGIFVYALHGLGCWDVGIQFSLSSSGCNTFPTFGAENGYIKVTGPPFGTCNYTIEMGIGSCP